jgi:Uma2 family endonuclease
MATTTPSHVASLADLLDRLGNVPLDRIRVHPAPGTATEDDLIAGCEDRLCELVDGVLVDKPVGFHESLLATLLIRLIGRFLDEHDLGHVLGADTMLRLAPGLVRLPDVSFFSWDRFPDRQLPMTQIAALTPDLAVEVLSPSNTRREMTRKLHEYFAGGCRLAWYFPFQQRVVRVYTDPATARTLHEDDVLEGGDVLPGFTLRLRHLFDRAGARPSV